MRRRCDWWKGAALDVHLPAFLRRFGWHAFALTHTATHAAPSERGRILAERRKKFTWWDQAAAAAVAAVAPATEKRKAKTVEARQKAENDTKLPLSWLMETFQFPIRRRRLAIEN